MNNHPLVNQFNFPVFSALGLDKEQKLIIAGPCAVESYEQIDTIAKFLVENNINYLRAGAFKPRTSPYDFQGLEIQGLEILKQIKEKYNLKIVSEIPSTLYLEQFIEVVDIIQVGARNMQNFSLLKALGKIDKPIMLKRGFGNTIDEWLNAAEYILLGGNQKLILCERGIKTFETATRNTLDLSAVAIIKLTTKIPIIVDPSHAAGRHDIIAPLSKAALTVGADGLLIEIHPNPKCALSDSVQALSLPDFKKLYYELKN